MTRDEISEQAARLATAMMLKQLSRSGANDVIETATDKMVDFYRATLEEAARAVCPDCKVALAEEENVADATFFWVHTDRSADPWRSKVCPAAPVHALIAALDPE